MIDINPDELMTWETKRLWNTLNILKNEIDTKINKEIYLKIKQGIKIKCPIWYFTEEWYEIYPSSKKVKVESYGKFDLVDFMNEKEERDNLIRFEILNNLEEGGIIEGRT